MLLFPARCHILLYLGLGVGCFSWSEACGVSNLKMDSGTSNAQIAHKSCSTHVVFMLLNTRHKSRLGYWIGTFFFVSLQLADVQLYLWFIPEPVSLHPWMPWPKAWHGAGAVTPLDGSQLLALQLWGLHLGGFCLPKALWREQSLKLDCE